MSLFRGYVQDFETEDYIGPVDVYLMKSDGKTIDRKLTTADDDGDFEFEAPPMNSVLQFSYPGYDPLFININAISYTGKVEMNKAAGATLEGVALTSKPRKKSVDKPNYTVPIIIGSVAVVTATIWAFKRFG